MIHLGYVLLKTQNSMFLACNNLWKSLHELTNPLLLQIDRQFQPLWKHLSKIWTGKLHKIRTKDRIRRIEKSWSIMKKIMLYYFVYLVHVAAQQVHPSLYSNSRHQNNCKSWLCYHQTFQPHLFHKYITHHTYQQNQKLTNLENQPSWKLWKH